MAWAGRGWLKGKRGGIWGLNHCIGRGSTSCGDSTSCRAAGAYLDRESLSCVDVVSVGHHVGHLGMKVREKEWMPPQSQREGGLGSGTGFCRSTPRGGSTPHHGSSRFRQSHSKGKLTTKLTLSVKWQTTVLGPQNQHRGGQVSLSQTEVTEDSATWESLVTWPRNLRIVR